MRPTVATLGRNDSQQVVPPSTCAAASSTVTQGTLGGVCEGESEGARQGHRQSLSNTAFQRLQGQGDLKNPLIKYFVTDDTSAHGKRVRSLADI